MKNSRSSVWLCLAVAAAVLGCVLPMQPKKFAIPDEAIHPLEGEPIEVRGSLSGKDKRVLSVPGSKVSVDEDEYTNAVVKRMAKQLRERGVQVQPGAERVIEIQVVRVSIHQKPQFTCVIDFNRRLGSGQVRGLQSRAEHWNYQTACGAAVSQVVIDVLNDQTTRDYLKGA